MLFRFLEMTMKTTLALAVVSLVSVLVAAQERRAPDPRSMGGGDCRDNVVLLSFQGI